MQGQGFLAIWSDLAPEDETDWAHWMTREHSSERVGVDGFLACRIFRALGATVNRFFILYDLAMPDIVGGPQYLARLNAPTPWSQRIMPRLRNFVRGGGRIAASEGIGQGGVLAVLRLQEPPKDDATEICNAMAALDRIAAARVLLTDDTRTAIGTREKSMRSGDGSFAGLLVIEGFDETAVRNALAQLRSHFPQVAIEAPDDQPLYRVFFNLQKPR
jgi:hypothetical protein